jgi:hypothetical protein
MARRIEITLTSKKPDGSYTWRAAGAREPKGVVGADVVGPDAELNTTLKVDADFDIDGIVITTVVSGGRQRKPAEVLALIPTDRPSGTVTQQLAKRDSRDGKPRGPRRDGDRPGGDRPRGPRPEGGDRPRGPRSEGGDRPGGDRPRGPRPEGSDRGPRTPREARPPVELPTKPKPKRLKQGRVHVDAVLSELPEGHRPIAVKVLRGGLPEVRQAVDEQNVKLTEAGQPTIDAAHLVALATDLQPRLRIAEWRDRADAALAGVTELDLRDLRSVLASANDSARDAESREIAQQLREKLNARIDADYAEWLADITVELDANRSIRALRLSSRPPKAGVPFPAELSARLVTATSQLLTSNTQLDRWQFVLESLAVSPVRDKVEAASVPSAPSDELKAAVTQWSGSVPQIARQFGIEPATTPARPPRRPTTRPAGAKKPIPPRPPRPTAAPVAAVATAVTTDAPADGVAAEVAPPVEAPAVTEAPTAAEAPAVVEAPIVAEAPAVVEAPTVVDVPAAQVAVVEDTTTVADTVVAEAAPGVDVASAETDAAAGD